MHLESYLTHSNPPFRKLIKYIISKKITGCEVTFESEVMAVVFYETRDYKFFIKILTNENKPYDFGLRACSNTTIRDSEVIQNFFKKSLSTPQEVFEGIDKMILGLEIIRGI